MTGNRFASLGITSYIFTIAVKSAYNLLHSGLGSEDEVRLVEHLFQRQGYNPLIRPVHNLSDTVTIKFGLAMIQLINVDEKNQIMKSNVWLRMLWHDFQLQWDPADYGGITVIRVIPKRVWKPDIVLFNNADGKYEVSYKPNVVLYHTGDILWIPPAIYKSSCTIDVKYFPFDQQECQMKFGSWTFNGDQVLLDWYENQQKVDLSDYVNSGTWDIIGCPGTYHYRFDEHEGHHKAWITFTLRIRRKTLFYTVNLIIPCVLISFLSVCAFYLPADAGEKMTMCISILLALVVFLLLVSKILPPTSITVPLIAKYLLFTFVMNVFTILLAVVIINRNFRTPRTHRMPGWVRLLFLNLLPRALLMKRPHHDCRWLTKTYNRRNQANPCLRRRDGNWAIDWDLGGSREWCNKLLTTANDTKLDSAAKVRLTAEAEKAIEAVRFIAAHLKQEDDYAEVLDDWRYVAMVIDRLQLYLFLLVTIAGTVSILMSAPHIFEFIDQDELKRRIVGSYDGTTVSQ